MHILNKKFLIPLVLALVLLTVSAPLAEKATASIVQDLANPSAQAQWRSNTGYVDELIFKVIRSPDEEVLALKKGDIDIIGSFVSPNLLTEDLLTDPNIGQSTTLRRGFGHISFNTAKFPTSSRALRQAFAWALDKNKIQQDALGGLSQPADSPIVPGVGYWSIEHPNATYAKYGIQKPPTYYAPNVQEGNLTLLEESFYDIDGDGYREYYNGNDAPFNLRAVLKANNVDDATAANMKGTDALQDYVDDLPSDFIPSSSSNIDPWIDDSDIAFKITGSEGITLIQVILTESQKAFLNMGIKATPDYVNFNTLLDSLDAGTFNAVFFAFNLGSPTPTFLQSFMSNDPTNLEIWRWSNSTYDELVSTVLTSPDLAKVEEANYKAQLILWREQPLVVMYNNILVSLYRTDKLEGWVTETGAGAFTYFSWLKVHLKGQNTTGGQLIQSLGAEPESQNFWNSNSAYTGDILATIYDSLWTLTPDTLEPMGWLADNMTFGKIVTKTLTFKPGITYPLIVFANGTTATNVQFDSETQLEVQVQEFSFTLNPNFKFHDGVNVTSADVKFTFELIRKTQSPIYLGLLVDSGVGFIDPDWIETPDDLNVKIYSLTHGFFEYLSTSIPIVPKHIWENIEDPYNFENPKPIGSGPYMWKSAVAGELYVLERNPNWPFSPTAGGEEAPKKAPSPGFGILALLLGLSAFVAIDILRKRRK